MAARAARQAVLGDTGFLIGASEDERVLLIFPEEAAGEVEARVDLSDGDMVTPPGTNVATAFSVSALTTA